MTVPRLSPECQGRFYRGSIVQQFLVQNPPAVMDQLHAKCLAEVQAIDAWYASTKPLYGDLDEAFVAVEEQWNDPALRTDLLRRMNSLSTMTDAVPSHMTEEDWIFLWAVRIRAYLDLISQAALFDILPPAKAEKLDVYYKGTAATQKTTYDDLVNQGVIPREGA